MDQLEAAILQSVATQNNAISSAASSALQSTISNLVQNGAPSVSLFATGTYSWSDLQVAVDGSNLPPLTNDQCTAFMSTVTSQSALKLQLASMMAQILPVPASAILFPTANLACGPYYPFGTRGDQEAVFAVTGLRIMALYTLFANGPSYVAYVNTSVDHSQQQAELSAPLNLENVRNALQTSLRVVFLQGYQQYLGLITHPFSLNQLMSSFLLNSCPSCGTHE